MIQSSRLVWSMVVLKTADINCLDNHVFHECSDLHNLSCIRLSSCCTVDKLKESIQGKSKLLQNLCSVVVSFLPDVREKNLRPDFLYS